MIYLKISNTTTLNRRCVDVNNATNTRFEVGYATKILNGLKRRVYLHFGLSKKEGNLE